MDCISASGGVVLSEDDRVRVERIHLQGRDLVRKTYYTPRALRWRTALRRSRALREFTNLRALEQAGLPAVHAASWSEERRFGCAVTSTLVTEFFQGAVDLHTATRTERSPQRRRALVRQLGALLHALHARGFCSTTSSLRNVLVAPGGGDLVFVDQPHLVRLGHGRLQRRLAQLDLFDAFFSPRRLRDWSSAERWRGVLAYCGGDVSAARAAWRRVARRRRWALRCDRQLARILGNVHRWWRLDPVPAVA